MMFSRKLRREYARAGALSALLMAGFLVPGKVVAGDDFTLLIMDVFTISGKGTVITGQVKSGTVSEGDTLCIPLTSGETVARPLIGIELLRKQSQTIEVGQILGVLVEVNAKLVSKQALLHGDCELADDSDDEQVEDSEAH